MELKKGNIIKTSLGENTVVLEAEKDNAILFNGNQYVFASGIKENQEKGIIEWNSGKYANTFNEMSQIQMDNFEKIKETVENLSENHHEDYVKAVISEEKGIENINALNSLYENFMNDDGMNLLDENFDYVIEDLKEQGIELNNEEKTNIVSLVGNLTKDVEISEYESEYGVFKVANFSLVSKDKEGSKVFNNVAAYNNKINLVKEFKKGDFVKIYGEEKVSVDANGKEHTQLKLTNARMLKAKEINKEEKLDNSKYKFTENKLKNEKKSTLDMIKKFKTESLKSDNKEKSNKDIER